MKVQENSKRESKSQSSKKEYRSFRIRYSYLLTNPYLIRGPWFGPISDSVKDSHPATHLYHHVFCSGRSEYLCNDKY